MGYKTYKPEREEFSKMLGRKLKKARENVARMSQGQVAKTKKVSQSELSKIESGKRDVSFFVLLKLAQLYGKDLRFFVPENFQDLFKRQDMVEKHLERTGVIRKDIG